MKEKLNISLDKEVKRKVKTLSKNKGMSVSSYLTYFINKLYEKEH